MLGKDPDNMPSFLSGRQAVVSNCVHLPCLLSLQHLPNLLEP